MSKLKSHTHANLTCHAGIMGILQRRNHMNLIKLRFFTLIVLLTLISLVHSDINKSNEELLSQAYGYLKGQDYSLSKISEANPDLKSEVIKTRLKFNSTFGIAKKNIELELETLFGDYFDTYKSEMDKQFKELFTNQTYEKETSLTFLREVEKRAEGIIETPVLETLLTYQFINNPSKELTKGFIKSYSTEGHPKSKNITVNAKLPLSWKQKETERPNIVQKFISNNGIGLESIMFMVKDLGLPKDYKVTQEEIDDIFNESELKHLVPENSDFISAKKIYLDGQVSGEVIFSSTIRRLDFSIRMKAIHFIAIIKGKMFFLQCGVTAVKNQDLDVKFNLFLPLFKKVANSLVFPEKYSKTNAKQKQNKTGQDEELNENSEEIEQSEKKSDEEVLNVFDMIAESDEIQNLNKINKDEFILQKEIASKKIDEGIGRIGAFLIIVIFYVIFKIIQWFFIKNKLSEIKIIKAKNNIKRLGKYSIIWAIIQISSAVLFIMSWQVSNLIIMSLISLLVFWAGNKLHKKESYSFKTIFLVFLVTLFFSFILPIVAIILLIQDASILGDFGFLWLKFFNVIQIIRFGPAFLTLLLCFFSISSMFSYLIIKKSIHNNTHNKRVSG